MSNAGLALTRRPLLGVYRWGAPGTPGQGGLFDGVMNLPIYEQWLGRQVDLVHDFASADSWDGMPSTYLTGGWQGKGRRLFVTYKILAGNYYRGGPANGTFANQPVSLGEGAAGKYDAIWTNVAQALVTAGHTNAIIRIGEEMNGGWEQHRASPYSLSVPYTGAPLNVGDAINAPYQQPYLPSDGSWCGGPGGQVTAVNTTTQIYTVYYNQPRLYATYWRRIVAQMKAVAPNLTFCWCPTRGYMQFLAADCYPGDDVVDYIGLDTYDEVYRNMPDTDPVDRWDYTLNGQQELGFWCNFAKAGATRKNAAGVDTVTTIAKPFALPEWGTNHKGSTPESGGDDNSYYVQKMYEFIHTRANNVQLALYFDVDASDGWHQLSGTTVDARVAAGQGTFFPNCGSLYQNLFGRYNGYYL